MNQKQLDAYLAAHKEKVQKAQEAAKAKADGWMADDNLARAKGDSPQQIEARRRVVALFCELHRPDEPFDIRDKRAASIDYTQPITTTNGRLVNMQAPKPTAPLGFGYKPAYLLSDRFPPKTDKDPIYCLEYYPKQKVRKIPSHKLLKKIMKTLKKMTGSKKK